MAASLSGAICRRAVFSRSGPQMGRSHGDSPQKWTPPGNSGRLDRGHRDAVRRSSRYTQRERLSRCPRPEAGFRNSHLEGLTWFLARTRTWGIERVFLALASWVSVLQRPAYAASSNLRSLVSGKLKIRPAPRRKNSDVSIRAAP